MWRHGDVFVEVAKSIPDQATELPHCILAKGEITGHSHRIEPRGAATMYRSGESLFLRVSADTANLVHEEHGVIPLERGVYRAWIQREYSPEAIRKVID